MTVNRFPVIFTSIFCTRILNKFFNSQQKEIMEFEMLVKPIRKLPLSNGIEGLTEIGDRIEYLRCILGYSPESFAHKLGTKVWAIERVLSKKRHPNVSLVQRINMIFGADSNWIITNQGRPYKSKKDYVQYVYSEEPEESEDNGIVGRVKEIRTRLKMTQAEFAGALNVKLNLVISIEAGRTKVTVDFVNKVVTRLGVPDPWILRGEGELKFKKERG